MNTFSTCTVPVSHKYDQEKRIKMSQNDNKIALFLKYRNGKYQRLYIGDLQHSCTQGLHNFNIFFRQKPSTFV